MKSCSEKWPPDLNVIKSFKPIGLKCLNLIQSGCNHVSDLLILFNTLIHSLPDSGLT